jgi:hypothetical protein
MLKHSFSRCSQLPVVDGGTTYVQTGGTNTNTHAILRSPEGPESPSPSNNGTPLRGEGVTSNDRNSK